MTASFVALPAGAAPTDPAEIERRLATEGAPLVDMLPSGGAEVTFVWRDAKEKAVSLRWPSFLPQGSNVLVPIPGSNLRTRTVVVPAGTRMSYRFLVDPKSSGWTDTEAASRRDPLNPHFWLQGDWEEASTLDLPDAPPLPYRDPRADVPHGKVTSAVLSSKALASARTVRLYMPPGSARPRWLLIAFDGEGYLTRHKLPVVLDAMIADRVIPPIAALFVNSADRMKELMCLPANAAMVADELLPWAAKHGADIPPKRRILTGVSLGGLASACAVLDRPERFGGVIAQSGSFWWNAGAGTNGVSARIADTPKQDVRWHLSAGQMEGGAPIGILENSRILRDALAAKGYRVSLNELAGGHDWYSWSADFPDALRSMIAAE
ncbi:alpha/beta hydrolase-fold protein [Sphingomonas sp. ID0503]|uniref:alpha/beta hydrolase-fold protein n=1 Tax=Sphingomonas sp. ID0503 TaxID=3399691 RepID=UPI003AFB5EE3